MDLTSLIIQQLAAQQAAQPVAQQAAQPHIGPAGFRTQFVNGRWVLVPTAAGRYADPALAPRVTVTPLKGGPARRLPLLRPLPHGIG